MKLTYRGIKYQHIPLAVEVTAEEIGGKYRGVQWKRHHSHIPTTRHVSELKYRGAVYYSGNPEEVEELRQRKKLNSIFATGKSLCARNIPKNHDLTTAYSANLCINLQRRLEVAKQKGDKSLILMLEDEAKQLSVNNCHLSFNDY